MRRFWNGRRSLQRHELRHATLSPRCGFEACYRLSTAINPKMSLMVIYWCRIVPWSRWPNLKATYLNPSKGKHKAQGGPEYQKTQTEAWHTNSHALAGSTDPKLVKTRQIPIKNAGRASNCQGGYSTRQSYQLQLQGKQALLHMQVCHVGHEAQRPSAHFGCRLMHLQAHCTVSRHHCCCAATVLDAPLFCSLDGL